MSAKRFALALTMASLPSPALAATENVVSRPVEEKNLVSGLTNLGDFLTLRWMSADEPRRRHDPNLADKAPRPVDYQLPASLAARTNAQADLRAAGKMNNFFGIMIDRMPAVSGVLAYQRDKVIDLKAETAAAAQ